MNTKTFRRLLAATVLLSLASCKKLVEHDGTGSCSSCATQFSNEKKLKSIEVVDSNTTTHQYYLFYTNGLIDSISHIKYVSKGVGLNDYNIKVFYAENSCIPSGYNWVEITDHVTQPVNANFLVMDSIITSKNIYRGISSYYSGDSSSSFGYFYNGNGTIKGRDYHYLHDSYPEIYMNNGFSAEKNLTYSYLIGDFSLSIALDSFDNKPNPFSFQNNVLYYLSVLPYNVFPDKYVLLGTSSTYAQYSPFDNVTLSKNNAGLVEYESPYTYLPDQYIFQYAYNADGYPGTITILTNLRRNDDGVDNTKKAEEIHLTYY